MREAYSTGITYASVSKSVHFVPGQRVSKGQLLFRLDSDQLRHQLAVRVAEQAKADAQLMTAEADFARAEKLVAAGFMSSDVIETKRMSVLTGRALVQQAAAERALAEWQLGNCVIVAPTSGEISAPTREVGTLVRPGDDLPLARIHSSDRPYVRVAVKQELAQRILRAPSAYMISARDSSGQPLDLDHSIFVDPTAEARSGLVMLRATFDNRSKLLPGDTLTVEVSHKGSFALRVPVKAIERDGRATFVYLVDEKLIARKRAVQTGSVVGEYIEVLSGLAEGDQVVVLGKAQLRDGDQVEVVSRVK